jgi:hypothetical protein
LMALCLAALRAGLKAILPALSTPSGAVTTAYLDVYVCGRGEGERLWGMAAGGCVVAEAAGWAAGAALAGNEAAAQRGPPCRQRWRR